ncbi:SNF family Na+-dependent transporter [Sanguibacter keddieii DSM 10542]|uniref:SNF family Na+-dependent transporter n=1 Tax=Sanguibacter keddieii (strain ATCC 51767 / DSM 10542 / NCFB 3025 / ST-74) TaxID=446469 RepID=D1BIQ9_SANKS|nr:sodium-dependent transporter [Sanguibacter keddieii]ACZ20101.1 SNF family Na+-dependent transporter [Sanguibacter keddieii DSM 10542]
MARAKTSTEREQWSGQTGFILAAIGSAVGLGNIWRFPGVAYENGGGAFLVPYVIALLVIGIPVLFFDYALGHRFRGSAPTVFRRLTRRAEALGWFQVGISIVIILYYTVIIAWALSFVWFSVEQTWGDDAAGFFTNDFLRTSAEPGIGLDVVPGVFWPLVGTWVVTLGILALGVQKGLERSNVIFLPLLVVLFAALVVRALFLDGATDGLNAFFTPDWSALLHPGVWIAAVAHIFFSLSIAFGIMVTYSSYLKRRSNLTSSGLVVAFSNSSFEILAGVGVFATLGFMAHQQGVGVDDLEGLTGPTLSFSTFPQIISAMPGGSFFGVLFFLSLAVAGLTSLLSLLQVVSAAFQEKFGWDPRQAALRVGGIAAVISILLFSTTTALHVLDVLDKWANEVGVITSAVVMTALVAWRLRLLPQLRWHLNAVSSTRIGVWWVYVVGVVVPLVIGYMLVSGVWMLITEGYDGYPLWFRLVFGWGAIAFMVVFAVIMTKVRWAKDPDDFVPWPPLPEGGLTTKEVRS